MSKPFNLEHAKAGAPVMLEDGTEATIIKFDGRNQVCPLVVLVGDRDRPHLANKVGTVSFGPQTSTKNLVMKPIFTLAGKEVHYGDVLLRRGVQTPVDIKLDIARFRDLNTIDWAWPAEPKEPKVYPVTRMTHAECAVIYNSDDISYSRLLSVANAAIAHGIDNGYLLDAAGRYDVKNTLGRIARRVGITDRQFEFADIEPQMTKREVAIARHFYLHPSYGNNIPTAPPPMPPADFFTTELNKVKP